VLPGGTGRHRVVSGVLVVGPAGLPDRGRLVQTWPPGRAPAASCCTTVYCGAPWPRARTLGRPLPLTRWLRRACWASPILQA